MSLDWTLQQAPMRFGLAEGVDPHQVPLGTLTTAENVCWDRSGRIQKRFGCTTLQFTGGPSLSRLIVRGNELACTDGTSIYSYVSGTGWTSRGRFPEIAAEWYTSIDNVTGVASCDMAILSNGQAVEAWVNDKGSGSLYYQIRDTTTNTFVTTATLISTGVITGFRIVSSGNTWVIVYATTAGNIKCLTSTGTTTLRTDAQVTTYYSIDAVVIGSNFVVVYPTNAGNIRLVSFSLVNAPVQQATQQIVGETMYSVSIHGAANEFLYMTWDDEFPNYRLRFASANPTTLVPTAASTLVTPYTGGTHTLVRETASTCLVMYSDISAGGYTQNLSVTNAGVKTVAQITPYIKPLSRPFAWGSRFYCVVATETLALGLTANPVTTADSFLIDVTRDGSTGACRLVAKIDTLTGGSYFYGFVTTACTVSSTVMSAAVPFQSSINTGFWGGGKQGVRYVEMSKGASVPTDAWRSVQVGQEAYIASGVLTAYDGVEGVGYGYPHGPVIDPANSSIANVGGNMQTGAGAYLYSVTAERRSSVGVLHRSPVARSYSLNSVAVGATGKVTLRVVPASLGQSSTNPGHFPVYRSIHGGSTPQRIAQEPSFMTAVDSGLGASVTFSDTSDDSSTGPALVALSTRPAIYTTGGDLEDTQPPSCLTLTTYQNRIWMVAGDGLSVWFSKDASTNPGTAPGFYPTNALIFEKTVTALCAMDDKLIVFAADTFWLVFGDGPAPNGQDSTYDVAKVQTDVGCTNPRSVVSTPLGIMFQSARGLHLLTRKLEVNWIGRPIKDQLAAYPSITSAVLVAAKNEIRWTANTSNGSAGIVLVYNYVEDQWSTFKYTLNGVYGAPIADACMWNGVYAFANTNGYVFTESSSSYLDNGASWVPITIETAWVSSAGPLAYQSVRNFALEGISNSNHDLTLSVGFDNETSYVQTATFLAGSTVTSIGPLESCQISIGTRRKCQSIRFKIQDATPTSPGTYPVGTGQGPSFDAIGLEVGVMSGFARKPATKRA